MVWIYDLSPTLFVNDAGINVSVGDGFMVSAFPLVVVETEGLESAGHLSHETRAESSDERASEFLSKSTVQYEVDSAVESD